MDNIEEIELGPNLKTVAKGTFSYNKNLKKVIFNNSDVTFDNYDEIEEEEICNFEVVAPKGSTAEKWAKDNGLKFTAK